MPTTLASCTPDQPQPYFYPLTIPENQRQPSNTSSRRASAATINFTGNKSRTVGDRRRSSGALSTHSQSQKPKKCIGDYIVGKTLGKGASGRVKLGVHRHTGEQVAIKIISKAHLAANPAIEKAVRREIAIMKLVHHPNVMSLIDVIDDPSSSDLYLILEYVEGGELFEYLVSKGRLSEQEARHHFQQIILGLDYCHHHLICHRDLKPENLLLNSKNSIKIADFGMASLQPLGSMLETSCGSPHYASPEIVAGLPYNGSSCDIWSCGVILYALLTGHLPFDDENIRQLLKKVKSGKYIMPDNISRQAQDLIRRILVVDPTKRLTMEQIMAHPWFRETEPVNVGLLPVPPTESEIGQPVSDPSEIDDRILETIKFLWGETKDEAVVNALVQKEHNMQKVVYVLLQQHAERYWQADHDDETDDDDIEENTTGTTRRRYRTIGLRTERDRQCISMIETTKGHNTMRKSNPATSGRPVAPWMPTITTTTATTTIKSDSARRYSAAAAVAATIRAEKSPVIIEEVPKLQNTAEEKKSKMKKSETFYARFVKNVLSPSRRHSNKDKVPSPPILEQVNTPSNNPTTAPSATGTIKPSIVGTLRRKNPFAKTPINTTDFAISPASMKQEPTSPTVPPKSTLRPTSNILQRNKIDPSEELTNPLVPPVKTTNKSATISAKRLSLRIPNAFRNDSSTINSKKFGFTLGSSNSRRQRKQLDLTLFQDDKQTITSPPPVPQPPLANDAFSQQQSTPLPPLPPFPSATATTTTSTTTTTTTTTTTALSNGSTLSSSSSSLSSKTSQNEHAAGKGTPVPPSFKSVMKNGTMRAPNFFSPRRSSQVSFKSMDHKGSHHSFTLPQQHRPNTPSLLSNSSTTITSPTSTSSTITTTTTTNNNNNNQKASWLSNLFFFKQPKICSIVVYSTHTANILRTLHKLMNQSAEARFYEKCDKTGTARYKAEIKTKAKDGKSRQVKCRIELIMSDLDPQSCLVQFTQQQGDGVLLNTIVHKLHQDILKEYPCPSSSVVCSDISFKEVDSANTSGTLVEEDN